MVAAKVVVMGPPLLSAATLVSIIIINMVKVCVADVAPEADDLGAPGARGVPAAASLLVK